jgi:hypothetical protein
MKKIGMLLGLASSLFCFSQPLTVQMVHDYNVGDVIYKQYSCTNAQFVFDSVMAKTYSINNDSITYTFSRWQRICVISQQTCTTTYTTYTQVVTNLTSTLYPPAQISYDTVRTDTSFISYCGKKAYAYKYKCITPCPYLSLNEVYQLFFYIEGLGGPYKYSYITGSQPGSQSCSNIADVLYWKKGSTSCGTRPTLTGIKGHGVTDAGISVYPNPAKDEITISVSSLSRDLMQLELFTVTGQSIRRGQMQGSYKMELKGLQPGIYFLKITGPDYYGVRKIIVE